MGLLPVVVLSLVPGLFGLSIPVVSALSILPLALVPFAFLAALTRFRLWDAEVFGRESAALVGAGLAGAALFAASQGLLSRAALPEVPYGRAALQVVAGLVLALSFVPARRGLSAALSRLQYGDAWSAREDLLALVRDLAAPRTAAEIGELLVSRTTRALGAAPAAFLPVLADGRLPAGGVDGGEPLCLAELPTEAARRTVRLSRRTIQETPTPAIARLRQAGFRTLSPLAASGRFLAVFALGDRFGRVPLSHEDLSLLETVLAPASLALDHARLYDEVRSQAESYRLLKEFHEDVVAGSAAAIASTDAEGRLSSVNPAFAALSENWINASDHEVGITLSSSVAAWDYQDPTDQPMTSPFLQPILLASRRSCHGLGPWYLQEGDHTYRFSLTSHRPDWRNGRRFGVAANAPVIVVFNPRPSGLPMLPEEKSFFSIGTDNVVLSTMKKSEDGDAVVLRLYEDAGTHGAAKLRFMTLLQTAQSTNIIEEEGRFRSSPMRFR